MSEKKSFRVLLLFFKGEPFDRLIGKIFAKLASQDNVAFTFVYPKMIADFLGLAKEKFDLIVVDLDPGMVNEIEGFYDALSPVEQLKVIGFGFGLPRDNGDLFPPNRIWNSASVYGEWMRKIRQILRIKKRPDVQLKKEFLMSRKKAPARKSIAVLLCVTKGGSVDVNLSLLLKKLGKEYLFQCEYLSLLDDLATIHGKKFDFVLVDLNPHLMAEVHRVYDYFSKDSGVKLFGYGGGWCRGNESDWPKEDVRFDYMEESDSACEKIRRLLSTGGR